MRKNKSNRFIFKRYLRTLQHYQHENQIAQTSYRI